MNTNVVRKNVVHIPKVGEKYKCVDEGWSCNYGETITIDYVEYPHANFTTEGGKKSSWGFEMFPNDFQLIEEKEEEMDITSQKLFVNVGAYAANNKISLKQAHEEIQEWLFDKGFKWDSYEGVSFKDKTILVLNIDRPLQLCWEYFESISKLQHYYTGIQELLIKRTCTVTLSPSIKEEFVEFNGKQYSKQKLEQALKLLENETAN